MSHSPDSESPTPWPHAGLETTAATAPDRTALVDNVTTWSYGVLADRVGAAMSTLRSHGLGRGKSVLLVAPNCVEAVAAYLAIVRIGATAVLVDRRAGAADAQSALSATSACLVVTDPQTAADLGIAAVPSIALGELVTGKETIQRTTDTDRRDVAAVFFTSGTTSRPKAVQHSIATLSAGARNMAHTLGYSSDDAAFLCSPLASITGISQIHLALDTGSRLILEDKFSAEGSLDRILELDATVLGGAPIILEELLTAAQRRGLSTLPLRAVALGGTMIPRPLLELATTTYGIVPSRVYGSSESPIAFASDPADSLEGRLADEGVAMPGTLARIDSANGELQLQGLNLFLGYLDPVDNDDAFTPDGWLRSGDLAELVAGRLRITGRLKEVVARKGLKISMAEVDECLQEMPGATAAATYGVPDAATGERLVVAIQTTAPTDISLEQMTEWLLGRGLARWKLPEQIVLWDTALPRTASGKIQRRELATGGTGRPTLLAARLEGQAQE